MPGQPKSKAFALKIDQLGGMEWLAEAIMGGTSIIDLSEEIGCSRGWLYGWMNKDPERHAQFKEARRISSFSHADDATQIVDQDVHPALSGLVRERANHRRWLAERANPTDFGKEKAIGLQINIGELHLDALKQMNEPRVLEAVQVLALDDGDADDGRADELTGD